MIADAARISLQVDQYRASGQPIPQGLLRINAALQARYERLPPFEQSLVARQYQADREQIAVLANRLDRDEAASAFAQQVDDTMRALTPGVAGKPNGVTMETASALRNYNAVEVKNRKLPTGAEADARVQRATGLTSKQYAAKLDKALEVRDKAKNSDFGVWRDYVREHFPGESFGAVNKLVRDWALESVGLEMQRRAERDTPATTTLKATPEDLRRLDIIEAVAEVEGSNRTSLAHKGHADRLVEIVNEGFDRAGNHREGDAGLRADIARAFLDHGGTFDINVGGRGEGHEGDLATDEIVSVSDDEE
jgi:hypothetical protein